MAQYDSKSRRETWFLQDTGLKDSRGNPVYQRMRFNLVEYDGSPDLVLEPINHEPVLNEPNGVLSDPINDDAGLVNRIELVTGQPFSGIHQFD
jgi:hypothetical protein